MKSMTENRVTSDNFITRLENRVLKLFALSDGRIGSVLFYSSFGLVYFRMFYRTTMFPYVVRSVWGNRLIDWPSYFAFVILCGLAGLQVLEYLVSALRVESPPNRKQEWMRFALSAATLLVGFLCWFKGGNKDPFILCCLAIAVIGRRFYPALLISTVIGSVFMVVAYLASMNGYIPYLVYDRGGEVLAHAFGICYRTDFAAHVLYLVMSYAILRGEKLHLWEYLMFWLDTWVVWRYSAARMNTACLVLFLMLLGGLHLFKIIKHRWPRVPRWTAAVHAVLCAASLLMIKFYPATGVNGSLDARVRLSLEGFVKYPLNLFGHMVEERGGGGIVDSSIPYFFLDISYVRTLIIYGICMLVVYLVLMTLASDKAAKTGDVVLALALIIVAIASVIEHHATEYGYNILLLAGTGVLSNLPGKDRRLLQDVVEEG